jgi:hypothetical protein
MSKEDKREKEEKSSSPGFPPFLFLSFNLLAYCIPIFSV